MNDRTDGTSTTRRRLLGAAGGVLAGAGVVSGLSGGSSGGAGQEAGTDTPTPTPVPPEPVWPLFQLNAFNTGYQPNDAGPEERPGAAWAHVEGGSYSTTPVVTDEEVFAADGGAGVVRALDVDSGATLWEQPTRLSHSRMTIDDRVLYVPTGESGSQLKALDPDTGEQQWSVSLNGTGKAAISTGNAVVVATTAGVSKVSTLSNQVDWEYDGVTLIDTSVAVGDNAVFAAGTRNGKVVRLGTSGSETWTNILGGSAVDAPTLTSSEVIVPFDEHLVALRTDSGREIWRYEQPMGGSVAVADDTAYGTTAGGDVFAVDVSSGDEQWRTSPLSGGTSPVLVGGLLFVAGTGGTLAALDPRDGSTVWSRGLGAAVSSNPAVYGGELYLGDESGRLAGLAAGASGGFDTATPTPTETAPPTDTRTATDSPTQPPEDPGGGDSDDDDDGGGILLSPTATDPPEDGGGIGLPIIGGAIAAVLAALGGGLWWRNQQDDEYDPLG